MNDSMPCTVDGCCGEAARGGLCWAHKRRQQRGQTLRPPIRQRPKTPFERITECVLAYADAEDDEAFVKARDNLRKAAAAYGASATSDLVRDALSKLKASGVKLGRPRKVTPEHAAALVLTLGSISKAAEILGVSWRTVHRALRMTKTGFLSGGMEGVHP